jgi:NAD(P)H-hydrate repair Nnr-like enzyme with NAD(P)H-hydrate epimerase domain
MRLSGIPHRRFPSPQLLLLCGGGDNVTDALIAWGGKMEQKLL